MQALYSRKDDPKYIQYLAYLNEYNDFYRLIVKNLTHSDVEERKKSLKLLIQVISLFNLDKHAVYADMDPLKFVSLNIL